MTSYSPPPPPVGPAQGAPGGPQRSYTCPWCATVSDGTALSCPGCGAPVDVKAIISKAGWYEMPGIKDMARLQFGQSHLQIEGTYVPVADVNLAPADSVYFTHQVLLWKDPQVTISILPMRGGWKRLFAGLPLIMTQAHGPGHIAFSHDVPGELVAVPLQAGQAVDVREHIFMLATGNITYDWFNTNIWFTTREGDETETHYPLGMFMDRFFAPQSPGLLLLSGAGNTFIRHLAQGETILIKPTALLYKDPTVQMQLHIEYPGSQQFLNLWRTWQQRYLWVRLFGPGRVAVQSAFKEMEENGHYITRTSGASASNW